MVILFDGTCNLCNRFVQFVLKRDRKKKFQFASFQSNYGMGFSKHFNISGISPETIMIYDGKRILTESDAIIEIFGSLSGFWKDITLPILFLIPRFIRNRVYRLIARNRYALFGKKEQCMRPTADVKNRFWDELDFDINNR